MVRIEQQMHNGLHPVKLNLSHAQVLKAKAGHMIQINHSNIGHGRVIHVHPETHRKLVNAYKKGTGARIHLIESELSGAGFMDILKKVASPVLSGLQGVAKELFPSHAETIDSVREGIRGATGYGLKPRKQMHKGKAMKTNNNGFMEGHGIMKGPQHYPGQKTDMSILKGRGMRSKQNMNHFGEGINPSGFY
jgi:hypothetical protein